MCAIPVYAISVCGIPVCAIHVSGGEIGGARGAGAPPLSKVGGQCPPTFTIVILYDQIFDSPLLVCVTIPLASMLHRHDN